MATNSLFPSFFRLFSQSEFAPHVGTYPTRLYDVGDESFDSHLGAPVDAATMIGDFVDGLLPFYTGDTEFNQAIIYNMDAPDAPPRPVGFVSFTGKVGTNGGAAIPASQSMYTFRTTEFTLLKIVMLDAPVTTDFKPFTDLADSAALGDLFDIISDTGNAFTSRGGGRPNQFVRATFKLNDELRHSYRLD